MWKWLLAAVAILVIVGAGVGVALTRSDGSESGVLLTVHTPQNETFVSTFATEVEGTTDPDAVVSVNGMLVEVDLDGTFSTTVSLEEGPNSIEVIASDQEGNEASEILTVIYLV